MKLPFKIITPERLVTSDAAACVTVPAAAGALGIMPRHTHILADLVPGEVHIIKEVGVGGEEITRYRIGKGIAEVSREGYLTVFTDAAELL